MPVGIVGHDSVRQGTAHRTNHSTGASQPPVGQALPAPTVKASDDHVPDEAEHDRHQAHHDGARHNVQPKERGAERSHTGRDGDHGDALPRRRLSRDALLP
jgi:hypothetical protein